MAAIVARYEKLLMRVVGLCLAMASAVVSSGPARSVELFPSDRAGQGDTWIAVSPMVTTHVGAFDEYVAPAFFDWFHGLGGRAGSGGGGSGGGGFDASSLFPNGWLPHDLSWRYTGRTGIDVAMGTQTSLTLGDRSVALRLIGHVMAGDNRLEFFAPHGFGVFTDPTRADAQANFYGFGAEASTPVVSWGSRPRDHALWLGGGIFAYRSHTRLTLDSAFFRVREVDVQTRLEPMLTARYVHRLDRPSDASIWRPAEFGAEIMAFRTRYFWTSALKINLRWTL